MPRLAHPTTPPHRSTINLLQRRFRWSRPPTAIVFEVIGLVAFLQTATIAQDTEIFRGPVNRPPVARPVAAQTPGTLPLGVQPARLGTAGPTPVFIPLAPAYPQRAKVIEWGRTPSPTPGVAAHQASRAVTTAGPDTPSDANPGTPLATGNDASARAQTREDLQSANAAAEGLPFTSQFPDDRPHSDLQSPRQLDADTRTTLKGGWPLQNLSGSSAMSNTTGRDGYFRPNDYLGNQFQNWNNITAGNVQSPAQFPGYYPGSSFGGGQYFMPNNYLGADFNSWNNLSSASFSPNANGGWNRWP